VLVSDQKIDVMGIWTHLKLCAVAFNRKQVFREHQSSLWTFNDVCQIVETFARTARWIRV
jgi:hypothetical protein